MQEHRIAVTGGELFYRESGKAEDPVILYIHGNLASSWWFKDVMEVPGYRCIAVDLPNCGDSFRSGVFTMESYAVNVEEFIKALNLKNCVAVGHSLGGVVCMELAARQNTSFKRMMLISPGPIGGLPVPKEHYPIIEQYKHNRELLKQSLGAVVPALQNPATLEEITDIGRKMNPDAYIAHADELGQTDYTNRLGTLPFPTLILRGNGDFLITEEMARHSAGHLGAQYVELKNIGHSPMVEAPEAFLTALEDFLE